ncbi:MAG: hypothetical protein ABSG96_07770 [Terracidiphilus sp.]|jgi:hypothetical protein
MPKKPAASAIAIQPAQPPISVGKDWPIVVNHLNSLAALPWTPETSSALGQIVANIEGSFHGPKNRKRTPKPKRSGKAK